MQRRLGNFTIHVTTEEDLQLMHELDNHPDHAWHPRTPMERYLLVEAHKNHGRAGLERMHEQLTTMPEQLRQLISNEEQFDSRSTKAKD